MSEKILNTRIQLRYDSFNNWKTPNDGRGALLKKGELAVAYLAEAKTATTPDDGTHPIMFKVGPGYFNELPWASALAADVYGWAKEATKPTYDADEIKVDTTDNHFNGKALDAALAEIWNEIIALTGGEEGAGAIADQIKAGIKAIAGDTVETGNYVTGVSIDENGNLKLSEAALPTLATGDTDGTVKFDGVNVAVRGLGSAAFTESTAYATSQQGTAADSAMQSATILGKNLTKDSNELTVDEAKTALGLKSAAYTESTAYATNTQGEKADSAIQGVKVSGADLTKDSDNKVDITDSIKTVAAAEINTLIGGASNADTIENINTLITYVNENGANTTAILTELYGESADTTKDSRIDALEKRSGLDKVGTVTKVSVGNGLTGEDITESGTITLDDNYVKTIKVNEAGKADQATNAENAAKATNADSAADSNKLNGQTADFYLAKNEATGYNDILTKTEASTTYQPVGNYATSEQGAKADNALQKINADTGLKVTEKVNNEQTISIDDTVTFIFDCGDAFGNPLN